MCEDSRRLNTIVFVALVKYGRIFFSNSEVVRKVVGPKFQFLEINLNRLSRLGHVSRMPTEQLHHRTLFSKAGNGWMKGRDSR